MILLRGGKYCISLKEQANAIAATLSASQTKQISKYTGENFYRDINCILRKTESNAYCTNELTTIIDTMLNVFSRIQPFISSTQIVLYRGIQMKKEDMLKFKQQTTMTDLGFVSTTTNEDVAKNFADVDQSKKETHDALLMKIYLLPNQPYKILPVQCFSKNPNENEIILPPKTIFQKISETENTYICLPYGKTNTTKEELEKTIDYDQKRLKQKQEAERKLKAIYEELISKIDLNEIVSESIETTDMFMDEATTKDYIETCHVVLKSQYGIEKLSEETEQQIDELVKTFIHLQKNTNV